MSGSKDVVALFENVGRKRLDCPLCDETGFPGEYRIWEHGKQLHKEHLGDLDSPDVESVKKGFIQAALDKAFVVPPRIFSHLCMYHRATRISAFCLWLEPLSMPSADVFNTRLDNTKNLVQVNLLGGCQKLDQLMPKGYVALARPSDH